MTWYLLFWLVTLCVITAPFLPALREWRFKTDAGPLVVRREQDANIRHFAHTFFDQISEFFDRHGIDPHAPPAPYLGEFRPGERVAFLGSVTQAEWSSTILRERRVPFIVIATGDLLLEGAMVYQQDVYCGGQLFGGSNATFRAIYAGTDLVLGDHCIVARWLHSQGHVHIGRASHVYGRVSSGTSITIAEGTRFERLNATLIRTGSDEVPVAGARLCSVPLPAWDASTKLRRLDEHTLLSMDSLTLESGVRVVDALITRGSMHIGAGAHLLGNVKAYQRLDVGIGAQIDAALVCQGPVYIEAGAIIAGPIISETAVVLASGAVVGSIDKPTTITAPRITIAPGCQMSGSVWAGVQGVVTTSAHTGIDQGYAERTGANDQQFPPQAERGTEAR